jgi:hypothetical protein
MRRRNAALIAAGLSHGLAWAAFLWLALWPGMYQGMSETAVRVGTPPGEAAVETTYFTASLIEVNGRGVIPIILTPVGLSAVGLLLLLWRGAGRWPGPSLWVAAALLVAFCLLGLFSIGAFYAPSALALLAAAVLGRGARVGPALRAQPVSALTRGCPDCATGRLVSGRSTLLVVDSPVQSGLEDRTAGTDQGGGRSTTRPGGQG